MYTPVGPQRYTPNSLSPSKSAPRATPASEYSQLSHGSPSDTYMDRPGSTASQSVETLSPFDPHHHHHQGPGISTGSHLHAPAKISHHVIPSLTSSDSMSLFCHFHSGRAKTPNVGLVIMEALAHALASLLQRFCMAACCWRK